MSRNELQIYGQDKALQSMSSLDTLKKHDYCCFHQ